MATKLPLIVRKSIRDEFENKREDLEKRISDLLGVPWTVSVDAGALYAIAVGLDSWAKDNIGGVIFQYADGLIYYLQAFKDKLGASAVDELNALANKHEITICEDDNGKVTYYNGVDIKGGQLRILFLSKSFGSNTGSPGEGDNLANAVHAAEVPEGHSSPTMSFNVRSSIVADYEPKISEVEEKFRKMLALPDLKLNGNFEQIFAAIKADPKDAREDWEKSIGSAALSYFEGLLYKMDYQGFGKDDMLQEGFAEAVEKKEIALRVVPKLVKGSYNEMAIEDGVCYIQTTPPRWYTNTGDAGEGLMELL